MGILMTVAIVAYSKYKDKTANKAFAIMSENTSIAAEEYYMDHIGDAQLNNVVTIRDLYCGNYLENPQDPYNKESVCYGSAKISKIESTGKMKKLYYVVHVVCNNHESCIEYPGGTDSTECNTDSNDGVNGKTFLCQ